MHAIFTFGLLAMDLRVVREIRGLLVEGVKCSGIERYIVEYWVLGIIYPPRLSETSLASALSASLLNKRGD